MQRRSLENKEDANLFFLPLDSGCSTLLKTIAGEMNGIYLDDSSYLNYQGKTENYSHLIAFD